MENEKNKNKMTNTNDAKVIEITKKKTKEKDLYIAMVDNICCELMKMEYFALFVRNGKAHDNDCVNYIRQNREISIICNDMEKIAIYEKLAYICDNWNNNGNNNRMRQLYKRLKELGSECEIDNSIFYQARHFCSKMARFRVQMYYFEEIIAYELEQLRLNATKNNTNNNNTDNNNNTNNNSENESKTNESDIGKVFEMLQIENANNIVDIRREFLSNGNNYEYTVTTQKANDEIKEHKLLPLWLYFLNNNGSKNFYQGEPLRILLDSNETYFDILYNRVYKKIEKDLKCDLDWTKDLYNNEEEFYISHTFNLTAMDDLDKFEMYKYGKYCVSRDKWSQSPYDSTKNRMTITKQDVEKGAQKKEKCFIFVGIPWKIWNLNNEKKRNHIEC